MLDLEPKPKPAATTASALYPFSVTGFILLFVFVLGLGLVRFTIYVWSSDMAGLASAMCVIFPVCVVAYAARYLLLAIESAAEGYDLVPTPPSPGEVEHVFGALLKLLITALFAFLPLVALSAFGASAGPIPIVLVILGSLYVPMALLGMAATGDTGGCFPGTVVSAILTVPGRYLRNALLGVGAGVLLLVSWSDLVPDAPLVLRIVLDAGAGFLLIVLSHRLGVMYREEFVLRSVIPFPEPGVASEEICTPRRPVSEIERLLEERRNRERNPT
jgi:hypothetical protein